MTHTIVVQKFGSSVLSERSKLPVAVHEVYRSFRRGHAVVVVVSAIGRCTDALIDEANLVGGVQGSDAALAQLLATGEQQSAALFTMALARAGIPATLMDASSLGLVARGERLDAEPAWVDANAIRDTLQHTSVVVVPGFAARHESGGMAVFGRGGSDLTAVFLANALQAHSCHLLKDVDGIYERDPALVDDDASRPPRRFGTVSYEDARRVSQVLVQPKAVELLQREQAGAQVTALFHNGGTRIDSGSSEIANPVPRRPIRVLLAGFGPLGQNVYRALQHLCGVFELVGIVKHESDGPYPFDDPSISISSGIDAMLKKPYDVLVDTPGTNPLAKTQVVDCLREGRGVVTANGKLLAENYTELLGTTRQYGGMLRFSSAVGGAAPMIEQVRYASEAGAIVQLKAILDVTSSITLDELIDKETAVRESSDEGSIGKETPAVDLDRIEDQLRILAQVAFGDVPLQITRAGVDAVDAVLLDRARHHGHVLRLVATVDRYGRASIAPQPLSAEDYLAAAKGPECRLVIDTESGAYTRIRGRGPDAESCAESVVADLIDLYTESADHSRHSRETVQQKMAVHTGNDDFVGT